MNDELEPQTIPDVKDWKIVQHDNRVYVESEAIAHGRCGFDDAWLEVAGNMNVDQKLNLARFVVDKMNATSPQTAVVDRVAEPSHIADVSASDERVSALTADNQRLRGLILKAIDRWWPFVHCVIGASQTAKNLHKELSAGIQSQASAVPAVEFGPVAEIVGVTESFGEGDDERFCEGTAVKLLKKLPKGTKLYTFLGGNPASVTPLESE
jgi:hypothetical protein